MKKFSEIILLCIGLFLWINHANSQSVIIDKYPPIPIPEIEFYDITGKPYSFEKFEGNVLLLHFWATWCTNCTQEMKVLDQLQKSLRKDSIIIIPMSEDFKGTEIVKSFYKQHKLKNLLSFLDENNAIFNALEINNLPTSFIIDTEGNNVAKITGVADWKSEEMINLLKSYIHVRQSLNADYANLLTEQSEKEKNNNENIPQEHDIPTAAITNISPVHIDNNGKQVGSNFTNIQNDQFSLRIKRPVNSTTTATNPRKEKKTDE